MFDQLNEAIQQMIDTAISGMHTSMPGKVVSYNPATNRAVVKPDLPKAITNDEPLESPQIVEVPVVWSSSNSGKSSFTMPLQPGDGVLLNFQQRSIENWLDGKMVMPDDPRQHDLSDCIAIPGCAPGGIVGHGEDVVLKFNDTQIRIKPDNTIIIGNNSGNITIDSNGNMTLKAQSIKVDTPARKFTLQLHTHGGVQGGLGNTQPPTPS